MTCTRQMAHVSHSTSQDHIATAFHFFKVNIFCPPWSFEGVLSSMFTSCSSTEVSAAILTSHETFLFALAMHMRNVLTCPAPHGERSISASKSFHMFVSINLPDFLALHFLISKSMILSVAFSWCYAIFE